MRWERAVVVVVIWLVWEEWGSPEEVSGLGFLGVGLFVFCLVGLILFGILFVFHLPTPHFGGQNPNFYQK